RRVPRGLRGPSGRGRHRDRRPNLQGRLGCRDLERPGRGGRDRLGHDNPDSLPIPDELPMSYLIARYWPHILIVVFYTAIVGVLGHAVGEWQGDRRAGKAELALAHVQRDAAQQVATAEAKARQAEQKRVKDLADLAAQHEKELQDAQGRTDRRVADLLSGNLRLRREIAAYATERLSRDSTAPAGLSAAAERGAELVGAAVGVGAKCDATQAALIEAYEKLRRPAP